MKKRKELSAEQLQSLVMNGRLKKFVSIEEGALLYSVGKNTFREMATDMVYGMPVVVGDEPMAAGPFLLRYCA